MDLEKLTKQQIILLTILVSFVTSIATGIVTVAFMDQAPLGVTQTINRVVERTIEKVVPEVIVKNGPPQVIKEEDLVVEAVSKNSKGIVRIFSKTEAGRGTFLGIGVAVDDNLVATDAVGFENGASYLIEIGGELYTANVVHVEKKAVALLMITRPEGDTSSLSKLVLESGTSSRLGQTILSLGGTKETTVSIGIVTKLVYTSPASLASASSTPIQVEEKVLSSIETDITGDDVYPGSPLISLSGSVIGLKNASSRSGVFIPAYLVKDAIAALGSQNNN